MGKGRVTIPTDLDVVPQTLEMIEEWGADAIRDCDGTEFPQKLKDTGAKIYATYYTTRKDNAWAKAHPEEIQQMYIMTSFHTAVADTLEIHLMDHLYPDMLAVNTRDDVRRWWEVMDRTTGEPVPTDQWSYEEETGNVVILSAKRFHEYTVSFLAYIMWDPVHMYNAVVNDWKDVEPQITFDVRQPKTRAHSLERLRRFLDTHEYVDVVRFTTFFHQFTLIFDELAREKYVDWFGYSASVSPYILEQFEKEVGYPFRPEYIIDQGYMNNTYRIPSKEFKDFQAFQRREVAKLAKEMVDIVHEYGKEAMMFMGDHWIGMEPFMDEFASIGLDAVVGSVGNGATLRLFSDIKNVKYTEGRFLPYFFPEIEEKLHLSTRNQELMELLELEKSLVYFTTSLRSNEMVLEKLLKVESIKKYPEDTELLEDVIIENKQAIEMANIYSGILSSMMGTFASVISNNLNIVMKVLAVITIVMSIPTIVFSAYGMNLSAAGMPFARTPWGFLIVIILSVVASIIAAIFLSRKKFF